MTEDPIPQHALNDFRRVAEKCKDASIRAEERAKIMHERFNVFSILLKEHDEVRLHTRFIHCLLDPKGVHDCGSLFLALFLSSLSEFPDVNQEDQPTPFKPQQGSKLWTVKKEASCPPYGTIDILIEREGFGIAIENKIYAREQDRQLEHYSNYLNDKFKRNALLIYLTLNGKPALTHGKNPYLRISYADHILAWLDKCLRETFRMIPVNQVLLQYREVVRKLTGKTLAKEAMNNIIEYISEHADIIRYIKQITAAIPDVRKNFLDALAEKIISELNNNDYEVVCHHLFPSSFGCAKYGTFIITPREGSNLSQHKIKIGVVNDTIDKTFGFGVYVQDGCTLLRSEERQLLESMETFLKQKIETQDFHKFSANEYFPTGWYHLFDPNDDEKLAELLEKPLASTVTETCKAIYRHIELLQNFCSSLPPPPQVNP